MCNVGAVLQRDRFQAEAAHGISWQENNIHDSFSARKYYDIDDTAEVYCFIVQVKHHPFKYLQHQ